MPAPRKTTKRPIRKSSARPTGRPSLRPAGRTSARPASRSTGGPLRRTGPKAKTVGDRPRLRGTKPTLVKKSERSASGEKPIIRRSTKPAAPRTARVVRTTATKFLGKRTAPVRRSTGAVRLVKKSTPKPSLATEREPKEATGTVRLNKYISNAGITSRRKADEMITQGKVTINGKLVTELGVQVKPFEDIVTVDGAVISPKPRQIYLLLNKPKDTITTTSDEKDRSTVLDYVQTSERVYPVGRLDRNTTGVLLLTNDGELTNRLTHPSFEIDREYHVTLDKRLETSDARKIAEGGIDIGEGDVTGAAELVTGESPNEAFLKLREGKNREVRRIFEALGYEVEKLDRVSFAGLTHQGMGRGESRALTNAEVHRLREAAGLEED